MQLYLLAWVLQLVIMILAPIAIAVWFGRRYRLGVEPFLLGAAVFLLFQMLTRIPAIQLLSPLIQPRLESSVGLRVLYMAILAATAGLFESLGRWVGYRFFFRHIPYEWRTGVAFGIGHATMESAGLVGLSSAFSFFLTLVALGLIERPLAFLPPEILSELSAIPDQISGLPWYLPLFGGLERLLTIPVQVALSLLVLQVFTRKETRWLWIAVGLHTLLDFTAPAMLQLLGWPIWLVEPYIAIWAAASVWLIVRWRDEPALQAVAVASE